MPQKKSNDAKWARLTKKLLVAINKHDWPTMKSTYYEQALILKKEGRDAFRFIHESAKTELSGIQGKTIEDVEIISPEGSCPVCTEKTRGTISLAEAIEKQPLPVSGCEHESCRCSYAPVLEEVVPPLI
ncbi:MAG: hypothetical protein P8105_02830 [Dehalococcoidia bacterium]|jgi:hypothetical protein